MSTGRLHEDNSRIVIIFKTTQSFRIIIAHCFESIVLCSFESLSVQHGVDNTMVIFILKIFEHLVFFDADPVHENDQFFEVYLLLIANVIEYSVHKVANKFEIFGIGTTYWPSRNLRVWLKIKKHVYLSSSHLLSRDGLDIPVIYQILDIVIDLLVVDTCIWVVLNKDFLYLICSGTHVFGFLQNLVNRLFFTVHLLKNLGPLFVYEYCVAIMLHMINLIINKKIINCLKDL